MASIFLSVLIVFSLQLGINLHSTIFYLGLAPVVHWGPFGGASVLSEDLGVYFTHHPALDVSATGET